MADKQLSLFHNRQASAEERERLELIRQTLREHREKRMGFYRFLHRLPKDN